MLSKDLEALIKATRREIPRAFESEEYIARRETILNEFNKRRDQDFQELAAHAQKAGFLLQATPVGMALIPMLGNRPLSEEEEAGPRPELREQFDRARESLDAEVQAFLKSMRAAERETRERLDTLDREVALHAVGGVVDDIAERYAQQPALSNFLAEVREAILADIGLFRSHPLPAGAALPEPTSTDSAEHAMHEHAFRKYHVNVIVDNSETSGAPVVLEPNPTYANLIGRIEREVLFGALVTDATLISPGALHRANGGYLVLQIEDVLRAPAAWDALKRALRERAIDIEDMSDALGSATARSLRPERIPLDVKVVLLGEPAHFQLLYALDSAFRELFTVRADFSAEIDRTPDNEAAYAAFVSECAAREGRSVDPAAAARLIDESSRMIEDQQKLSARFSQIADLVHEANYWAKVRYFSHNRCHTRPQGG